MADFFTTIATFQALQDRIPFDRFGDTCIFLGETPWNRPTGIITFFAITQEGVDQPFFSSNSTEISIRWFYVQNFITIGSTFEELSCKRPNILTDSIVSSLFEYTKVQLTLRIILTINQIKKVPLPIFGLKCFIVISYVNLYDRTAILGILLEN